jgi:hypothetical protein
VSLTAGDKLGPYEILALIGKGGMGEVYRAHDPRLRRDVAIKVSAERFSERFEREARAVAALNHPNICTLHDIGPNYLVMELVEGESPNGPLPPDEVRRIAAQIAAALEAAHEKGIVHRDLKPANIKIKPDGTVKVLDFGLAQHTPPPKSDREGAQDPTLSMSLTEFGVILGTAAYMSPEQAQGKTVDKRTDIWAFGVLFYELLTGRHLFKGDIVQETLSQVLTSDPDLSRAPANVQTLLRRCLQRDPQRRLRDIGDAMPLIEDAPALVVRHGRPWPWAVAATLGTGLVVSLWLLLHQPDTGPRPVMRWTVTLPGESPINGPGVALSPDGTRLAYAEGTGRLGIPSRTGRLPHLWLRRVDQFEESPILGTNNGLRPFFSPDGQSIGYFTGTQLGALMMVPVAGGKPVVLCDRVGFYGGTWGEDGTIVYSGSTGLMRVAASGGMCQPLTNADSEKGEAHRWPQFLPGGQAIVFTIGAQRSFDSAQIAVLDLKTGQQHVVVNGGSTGRYVPSGHLVYVRGGTMFAVPFDTKRLRTTGAETQIMDGVYYNSGGGFADYAFSNFGLLVYATRAQASNPRTLEWVDRAGNRQPLPAPPQEYLGMRLSPDGRSAALEYGMAGAGMGGSSDIWTYELARGAGKKLTSEGVNNHPLWTPDGQRVAFHAGAGPSTSGIYGVSANAGGKEENLMPQVEAVPDSWTSDGKTLLYTQRMAGRSRIWAVALPGVDGPKSNPRPLLDDSAFDESDAQVSADGHWVAYTSDESGKNQVYVRPFHGPGNVVSVSIEGGQEPRWPRDGRELFYRDAGKGELMVVAVQTSPALGVSKPRALFELRTPFWDVAPDGKRFLAVKGGETTAGETTLRVVDNWFDELRRKAPPGK